MTPKTSEQSHNKSEKIEEESENVTAKDDYSHYFTDEYAIKPEKNATKGTFSWL